MIVIDGQQQDAQITNFENLEDLLVKVLDTDYLDDRVVTDVLVNDETFSEIYPHQAEDIETAEIQKVEIRTTDVASMARSIIEELYKVVNLMDEGAQQVAELFRQADDSEALEMYQDLIDVTRDFLGMVGVLRDEFSLKEHQVIVDNINQLSELFSEMLEVVENEDWILLSDLLEFEFIPAVKRWREVLDTLRGDVSKAA
jgi:hypothetical protein